MRQDKTKLTRSLILQDIQVMYRANKNIVVGSSFLTVIALAFGFYCLADPVWGQQPIRSVTPFVLSAFFLIFPIALWLQPKRMQKQVASGNYRVVTDHLLAIEEGHLGKYNSRPPSLVFRGYGRFSMDWNNQDHQVHSAFCLQTVRETAQIGEAYYLVLLGNRIIGAYSHRFFELESQDQ